MMPLKLNLKQQTIVAPRFWEVSKEIWKERWKALNDEILNADPRFRKFTSDKNAPMMSRLRAACTDRKAFDYEKTQLLCLPFVKFWVEDYNGVTWLAGLTQPIILSDLGSKRWQGPRYTIYVSRDVSQRATSAKFHFVPEGHELIHSRHPHHTASMPAAKPSKNPLDMTPSTCWGSFGTMVQSCARGGEVTNLFRTLHLYLSRVDMKSLYTTFELCPFKELPAAKLTGMVQTEPERRPVRRRR